MYNKIILNLFLNIARASKHNIIYYAFPIRLATYDIK